MKSLDSSRHEMTNFWMVKNRNQIKHVKESFQKDNQWDSVIERKGIVRSNFMFLSL